MKTPLLLGTLHIFCGFDTETGNVLIFHILCCHIFHSRILLHCGWRAWGSKAGPHWGSLRVCMWWEYGELSLHVRPGCPLSVTMGMMEEPGGQAVRDKRKHTPF